MNRLMDEKWPWIEAAHGLRAQLFDLLDDAGLAFAPGGQNMTLGALCRQMGETEYAYIQSLQTGRQEWTYRHADAAVAGHAARLRAWLDTLDDEMKATIFALSDEDHAKTIDRGGFPATVDFQLDCYLQAVLIFWGKATIYLKAMNTPVPQNVQEYIG